jgi:DNA-binding XRE family transcriptional regulator
LGEHLRKKRHELGLYQKDVAKKLGVNPWALIGWETDWKKTTVRFMPRILKFLGYNPFPDPCTLGGRLLAARRRLGLSQKEMARKLGVDEGTVRLIETGRRGPAKISWPRSNGRWRRIRSRGVADRLST